MENIENKCKPQEIILIIRTPYEDAKHSFLTAAMYTNPFAQILFAIVLNEIIRKACSERRGITLSLSHNVSHMQTKSGPVFLQGTVGNCLVTHIT